MDTPQLLLIHPIKTNTRVVNSLDQLVESRDNINNAINYTYDSNGNLIQMQDSAGNITTMQYDILGNKVSMTDPDSGTTTYSYDALGQLISQTDANNQTVSFSYDALGRMLTRTEDEGLSTWSYDTAAFGIGKLASVDSAGDHQEVVTYDSLGRVSETTTTIAGTDYTTTQSYDQYSRTHTLSYPSGFTVRHEYNTHGFLEKVLNHSTSQLYWQGNAIDARGQMTSQTLGNGLTTTKTFDALTGFQTSVQTGTVQHLTFNFDGIGNLNQRRDELINKEENFTYDALNRLLEADVVGGDTITMTYDDLGNITSMSDVGSYIYGENGAGPHAVTSIIGTKANTYTYDANGNRISSLDGNVQYSSFNKPVSITKGTTSLEFEYSASRARYKQLTKLNGILDKTKIYVGGLYEEEIKPASTKQTHFIRGGDSTVAIYTTETGLPDKTRYLHKDHLGSLHTISDESGNTVEVLSFDAWGNRRNSDWSKATTPITSNETDRGFTGHEQLDLVNLIHMNGRVYDPTIGRFLSADPNIQAPENTQSLNRYSYVLNNPLSYTDPSGFFFSKIFKAVAKLFKKAISVVGEVVTGKWLSGISSVLKNFILSQGGILLSSFVALQQGASFSEVLKSALLQTGMALATAGISSGLNLNGIGQFFVNQAVSAGVHLAMGGKLDHQYFSQVFISTAINVGINYSIEAMNQLSAGTSGTATEQGGGKFCNGACTKTHEKTTVPIPKRKPNFSRSSLKQPPIPGRKPNISSASAKGVIDNSNKTNPSFITQDSTFKHYRDVTVGPHSRPFFEGTLLEFDVSGYSYISLMVSKYKIFPAVGIAGQVVWDINSNLIDSGVTGILDNCSFGKPCSIMPLASEIGKGSVEGIHDTDALMYNYNSRIQD